jgi:hypothetical protein
MIRKKLTVRFLDETPGAFRYREVNNTGAHIHGDQEGSMIGDFYIRKAAMPAKPPRQITVTIEY